MHMYNVIQFVSTTLYNYSSQKFICLILIVSSALSLLISTGNNLTNLRVIEIVKIASAKIFY